MVCQHTCCATCSMVAMIQSATLVLHTWLRHRHVGRLIIVEGGEVQHRDARPRCVSHFNHNDTPRTVTIDETLGDEHYFWRHGFIHVSVLTLRPLHSSHQKRPGSGTSRRRCYINLLHMLDHPAWSLVEYDTVLRCYYPHGICQMVWKKHMRSLESRVNA